MGKGIVEKYGIYPKVLWAQMGKGRVIEKSKIIHYWEPHFLPQLDILERNNHKKH